MGGAMGHEEIAQMPVSTANLKLPTTAAEAIAFALDHLPSYETTEFLADWREGKNLQPWLDALKADRTAG